MKKIKSIPNPNAISKLEFEFIQSSDPQISQYQEKKDIYKGRMISMSDSFYLKLNNYLKCNPTEGNRSSFMVRIVSEYIDKKQNNI
ncbi:hypothetical protein A3305_07370 (plasmid) [Rickettsia amblyommatis]|uniref:Uncharacterized protein n=1 Tax=Rickettsia amblyommatis (strain GAT-30V) TaxID=1105111 RepID=H8K662_RICAG|nr:hypothetical protein [Rickettsia amblyommatis]AFC70373.1 hypothetical protein MCE_08205 [Rickettsia amblyommatis str. GAT-30V]AFC70381.1 hypothetical protein MCE_08245 [Rickettsia amblyommatis str. GAT-30V]ARD88182.1 hypothetical protein A3305_07335 [Rickettsia amblyommatis]ARD88186.1 hypothetical protein A3305_07370 [Rickettsia amblyommatis]KJV98556.1 hypothetical protein RAMDARK_1910 [Rickettsia amblyommatis str. Darkwater]